MTKTDVRAIQLKTGLLSGNVFVVFVDGSRSELYFVGPFRKAKVRSALQARGWPVEG